MRYLDKEEQDWNPEEQIRAKLEWWCWQLGQAQQT